MVVYSRQAAIRSIEEDLLTGRNVFARAIDQRLEHLLHGAELLSGDFAFKQAFFEAADDRETLLSALVNHRDRIGAHNILLADLDGRLVGGTWSNWGETEERLLLAMIDAAMETEFLHADSFALLEEELYALVVIPLLAPRPEAWICLGFSITDEFAADFKSTAGVDISFLQTSERGPRIFASTLTATAQASLRHGEGIRSPGRESGKDAAFLVNLDETYVASWLPLTVTGGAGTGVLLQRSLQTELAPYRRLQWALIGIAVGGLVVTGIAGVWLAGSVSRPVADLVAGTRRVDKGDYTTRVTIPQKDELGELAHSFNRLTEGMAERDRVRDTLGKVVSPEIARELMRRDIQLGGEEREVTVLFADIRGFTTLSEKIPAAEVVSALNLYLTRMSRIIEEEGGVVDKFIGDEIMALFGAPVQHGDDAGRAVRTALRMVAEVDRLAGELSERKLPAFNIGIGVNTAVVIAGNMGSESRLNYTVIGDGVNLASRLQTLTREPQYNTRILVGEGAVNRSNGRFTFRPLGEVQVKGRQGLVKIFAVDEDQSSDRT